MAEWVQVGAEMPVLDVDGNRPEFDADGVPREKELVPYEPLEWLELQIDSFAKVADRRFLESTLDNLSRQKAASIAYAPDFETSLEAIAARFIKGARDMSEGGSGVEYAGDKAREFLMGNAGLDFSDALILLQWLLRRCRLAHAKKKRSKSL